VSAEPFSVASMSEQIPFAATRYALRSAGAAAEDGADASGAVDVDGGRFDPEPHPVTANETTSPAITSSRRTRVQPPFPPTATDRAAPTNRHQWLRTHRGGP